MSPAVDQELGERILFASKVMVNILVEALIGAKVQGLSAPQYRVLDMIYNGVDKPAELARMLDISPPAISSILSKLEEGGFMDRGHIKEDRRRVVLKLTGMGKDVVRRVNTRRRKLINAMLDKMDEQEIRQLETSLEAFTSSYLQIKGEERAGDHA
ncbi:MAG: MarR family transcriptional regulator [Actinomycetia bacterium]|nr:MarR family transcriptional regulator [Actinomycetota bacterium]MBU4240356.1 MarR family transcriptional regulator [Actinomycetota bacterium]MCG2796324.1 MarR family transcriptional regulator [Actinomycetes bacterium]